jgi:nucleoredoxin
MRLLIVLALLLQNVALLLAGKLPPLTIREVSLMLRSGYSVGAVQREVATRHFLEPIDAAAEKTLLQAGATTGFIAALKSGAYAVPAAEIAAVQQELALKARRRAVHEEESRRLNTLYQHQLAQARALATPAPAPTSNVAVASLLKGDLVTSKNGILSAYNDQAMEKKKLIGLYFSALWCGPCRKFTPELVQYYNRIAAAHPDFEIVFVSQDRSGAAMERYMRDMQMPWPAVKYEKVVEKEALMRYAGPGIPCLVLLDANGQVISHSYAGDTYLGPAKVLADLDQIFAGGAPGQVASRR